ncbi:hypothetical protein SCUCBS95973_001301 [Sporothrix curviconia]|uniref:Uncharacterized protein n=1 Tax=Sporothrix curviconia TaxID=1260050 RepID=A0ABP0AXF9_9PEZI
MDGLLVTLRQALSRLKPLSPPSDSSKAKQNAKNATWPLVDNTTLWSQFNIHCLNQSYGPLLDSPLPPQEVARLPPVDQLASIMAHDSEKGIRADRMIAWTDTVLQPTLAFGKSQLGLHKGVSLSHTVTSPGKTYIARIAGVDRRRQVDHIVALDNHLGQSLVVGLCRSSASWDAAALANSEGSSSTGELFWPLRQLADLCMRAQTRYGYIQTDHALVACCFTKAMTASAEETLKVLFMPVPWNTENGGGGGQHALTTEMALWWLCMLSMADRPRALMPMDQTVPIDAWVSTNLNDGFRFYRSHYYSCLQEPVSVPMPQCHGLGFAGAQSDFGPGIGAPGSVAHSSQQLTVFGADTPPASGGNTNSNMTADATASNSTTDGGALVLFGGQGQAAGNTAGETCGRDL